MSNFTPYLSARSATPTINSSALQDRTSFVDRYVISNASRASNAANAILPLGVAEVAISVVSAWIVPLTSQAGSATNFASVNLVNLGSGSAGTVIMASKTFSVSTASVAAMTPGSFALGVASKTSAEQIGVSYTSAGNGIALVAHDVQMAYRYI